MELFDIMIHFVIFLKIIAANVMIQDWNLDIKSYYSNSPLGEQQVCPLVCASVDFVINYF